MRDLHKTINEIKTQLNKDILSSWIGKTVKNFYTIQSDKHIYIILIKIWISGFIEIEKNTQNSYETTKDSE